MEGNEAWSTDCLTVSRLERRVAMAMAMAGVLRTSSGSTRLTDALSWFMYERD